MADQELSFARHFAGLTDPRFDRTRLHDLADIMAIAVCAVVAGADSWEHIEQFARAKHTWLKGFLALPNGIPSHDTIARVFARLDPDEFRRAFLGWIGASQQATGGRVVAIDGKTLRRSFDRAKGNTWSTPGPRPTTSCWANSPWTRSPTRSPPSLNCCG